MSLLVEALLIPWHVATTVTARAVAWLLYRYPITGGTA